MKELTSYYDDIEKRLAIFFGLGALVLSALYNLLNGAALENFVVSGVLVGALAILGGWFYGGYLRRSIEAALPKDELPNNVELRSQNAQDLHAASSPLPAASETIIPDERSTGKVVDFTMPEFSPLGGAESTVLPASGPGAPAGIGADDDDLPPPPVPGGLR